MNYEVPISDFQSTLKNPGSNNSIAV